MFSTKNTKIDMSTEDILSKIDELSLFRWYIPGLIVNRVMSSPLREDRNPSFCVYIGRTGKVRYKDYATGESGNVFKFLSKLWCTNFTETIKRVYKEVLTNQTHLRSLVKKQIEKPLETVEIGIVRQDFTTSDLAYWGQYGITKELLEYYNVFSVKYYLVNGRISGTYQAENPIFAYKIFDKFKVYRPLAPKNNKWRGNLTSFDIQGFEQLEPNHPEPINVNDLKYQYPSCLYDETAERKQITDVELTKPRMLIITKSLKDVMTLKVLGYTAIAPPSESSTIPEKVVQSLKKKYAHIFILYDRDSTGLSNARKLYHQYGFKFGFINKKYKAKDISDVVSMYGLERAKQILQETLK